MSQRPPKAGMKGMDLSTLSKKILREIKISLEAVSEEDFGHLCQDLKEASRIFLAGRGRSELMLKAFAMRLMHLGFETYVIGETITPATKKSDLLLLASGSGETSGLIPIAKAAKKKGAKVALITAAAKSSLRELTDTTLLIPAPSPRAGKNHKSIQPLATLFEQALLIVFDAIVLRLMEELGVSEREMWRRHANLE